MVSISDFQNQTKQYIIAKQGNYNNMISGLNQYSQMGNQLQGLQGNLNSIGLQQSYYPEMYSGIVYDYNTGKYISSPVTEVVKLKSKELTNIEWLDQRVNEMRIKL